MSSKTAIEAAAELEQTLRKVASALREADVDFMLGGSSAVWVRGGPRPLKDVDVMVRPEDAERALAALEAVGMRPERPPEEWLLKAWDGDVLVDIIFQPMSMNIDDEAFGRAEEMPVLSISMKVMALEDVIATKLLSLNEQYMEYRGLLDTARALREQIDWDEVRSRTEQSPFAAAFFTLCEGLGIIAPAGGEQVAEHRVRVVPGGTL